MRRSTLAALAASGLLFSSGSARGDDVPADFNRLVLDTGRIPTAPAEPDLVRFQIHGEEQLRLQGMRSFPLDASATVVQAHPGAISDSLGQNTFLTHWLRITPILQITDKLTIIGQADLSGLLVGDVAHDTWPDQTPRDSYDPNLQPRWLYLEWLTPVGLLRVGQQGNHWGMGIVANDGDHPSLFGDYRYGNITEQILFATKPLGIDSPFVVALAGNVVYRDNFAILTNGDVAWQGILAAFYEQGPDMLGLYGVYRHQTHDRSSEPNAPYTQFLDVGVLDVAGHFARPIELPRSTAFVFGSVEAALELGNTNIEQTFDYANTTIRAYGGAAVAGIVLASQQDVQAHGLKGERPDLWGRVVASIEAGYATGDANPYDGVEKRFVFDPNHKVGLLLFDEIMRWQTARASAAAQDANLSNGQRPPPGASLLPTNGGVFGAEYLYPTFVYRPRSWLDLKLGSVIAQTTADYVDPYRLVVTKGGYVNYQGGSSQRHDLGVELDGGLEARAALEHAMVLQVGCQAGVLLPGGALADASGTPMKPPWVA
ncbi:MAG TPA: hypothetical protein VMI75_22340, partial [Polyangiaceae bacterium]|nr:hypothetical protein [Polyangiaceae bacterium]